MDSDTDAMRTADGLIEAFGSGIKTDTESGSDDMEAAGEGNSGFSAPAAAASAASEWIAHFTAIGNNLADIGSGVVEAANDIDGTDSDNSQELSQAAGSPQIY